GVSAVTGGAVSLAPDAAPWGLWKSTDGGQTFSFVWDGHASARGVNHVALDSHGTLYAAAFQQGIWRSADGGSTWEQVFATQEPGRPDVRLLRDPVLVRQLRRLAGGAPGRGLHRRVVRLQPVRLPGQQRARRAALAGRRGDVDRPDA